MRKSLLLWLSIAGSAIAADLKENDYLLENAPPRSPIHHQSKATKANNRTTDRSSASLPTPPSASDVQDNDEIHERGSLDEDDEKRAAALALTIPKDDDAPTDTQSCWCEEQYEEYTNICWTISRRWWSLFGFTAGQAASMMQVLSTIGTHNADAFSAETMVNFLIAGEILTQSSTVFHALQAYAKQRAKNGSNMLTQRLAAPETTPTSCLSSYSKVTGALWRIAGDWFDTLGFLSSQTAVVLQFLSPIATTYPDHFTDDASFHLLLASLILTQTSACLHAFQGYALQAATGPKRITGPSPGDP